MRAPDRTTVVLPERSRRAGRSVYVIVQEPSVSDFAEGMPDTPLTVQYACYANLSSHAQRALRLDWENWTDRMLAKTIVEPAWLQDAVKVKRLGLDREFISKVVMERWGVGARPLHRPNFLRMVRKLALMLKIRPTEILAWPTGEFWLDWYILCSPELDPDEKTADNLRLPPSFMG